MGGTCKHDSYSSIRMINLLICSWEVSDLWLPSPMSYTEVRLPTSQVTTLIFFLISGRHTNMLVYDLMIINLVSLDGSSLISEIGDDHSLEMKSIFKAGS